jgi:hypothetical protein
MSDRHKEGASLILFAVLMGSTAARLVSGHWLTWFIAPFFAGVLAVNSVGFAHDNHRQRKGNRQ